MHVPQLLYHLFLRKYVEVIGARIPKRRQLSLLFRPSTSQTFPCHTLFENLHRQRDISIIWLTDERMKVLRHHDITNDEEFILLVDVFKNLKEGISLLWRTQKWPAFIATAGM